MCSMPMKAIEIRDSTEVGGIGIIDCWMQQADDVLNYTLDPPWPAQPHIIENLSALAGVCYACLARPHDPWHSNHQVAKTMLESLRDAACEMP